METRKELKTVKVDYECPKCKQGKLRHDGKMIITKPAKYPHSCNNPKCDYREIFIDKIYPYIDYE